MQTMDVNGNTWTILRLLGHGKGGYSYLAQRGDATAVLKQIHHEPCDYYTFGNKIEAEQRDYHLLRAAGIRIPELLGVDLPNERILKQYIPGDTVCELLKRGADLTPCLAQVRRMAAQATAAGLNIDYFPTNFVLCSDTLYYIDYECNPYSDQWNFDNWGVKYWSRTPEFEAYLASQA